MRDVESIDLKNRVVTVSPGFRPRRLELPYDYLVIGLGSVTNFYGMPGMLEHAKPFRTLADAMALRSHVIRTLEEAEVETDPETRKKLLTFVVAGGGFSGVEVIAELNDFVHGVKRRYLRLRHEPVRCVLVHSGDRILPEMVERLAVFSQKILRKRGVEILLKDRLAAASSEEAFLGSGIKIPCKTIISTVPSALPEVLQKLDCAKERDRLLVNGNLELVGYEGQVWAVGDCAAIKTKSGNRVPPTAQHAIREAKTVAHNIAATMHGTPTSVFAFEGLGGGRHPRHSGVRFPGMAAVADHLPDEDAGLEPQGADRAGLAGCISVSAGPGAGTDHGRHRHYTAALRARGGCLLSGRPRGQRVHHLQR
jgi:NADH dehydrogenase